MAVTGSGPQPDEESGSLGGYIYLRPLSVAPASLCGPLLKDRLAAPLAGGWAAFTHLALSRGGSAHHPPVIVPVPELTDVLAHEADADRDRIEWLFDNLTRRRPPWQLAHGRTLHFDRPRIMGIVNVTPDSFSDGGRFFDTDTAIAHARALAAAGADIVDVGGESTRPGAEAVDEETELARVIPVIEGLADLDVPISVDTRRSAVMRAAVEAGAAIVNDVSGLTYDSESPAAIAASGAGVVLMHSRGDPQTMQNDPRYDNVTEDVFDWLEARVNAAVGAGIARDRLVIDPGIGFGKTVDHNMTLLRELAMFHGLGVPLLLGASRKRFIGEITETPKAGDRLPGSLAAGLWGMGAGAQILRVHDVGATRQALAMTEQLNVV